MPSSKTEKKEAARERGCCRWIARHREGGIYTVVIVALVAVVCGGALAVAKYALTVPFAQSDVALEEAKVGAKRSLIFPEAQSFEEVSAPDVEGLNKVWKADTGDYVFDVQSEGYHGPVELMIGISKDGKVAGIQVVAEDETDGIGTNALTDEYLGTLKDLDATGTVTVKEAGAGETHVDGVSGATFTSNAVAGDINIAIEAYAQLGGN